MFKHLGGSPPVETGVATIPSCGELQAAINRYLAEHNQARSIALRKRMNSWTRSADAILDRLATIPVPSV